MHRHGYQGRKFGRERDQRRALIKSQADSLVINESITTTLPKAKELSSYLEKLITKAKKGDLHSRRQIISSLATKAAAHKLVDEIAPKLTARNSGHLRIEKGDLRRGDNAQMATISFVDNLKGKEPAEKAEEKSEEKLPKVAKPAARRTATQKAEVK
jgi:large subunit ribosomal protein L17